LLVVACAAPAAGLEDFETELIRVDGVELTVAIADTSDKRQRGLADVEDLPDLLDGMLFAYDSPTSASFHMLNTPMPLDIWWFDSVNKLVGTTEMEPCFVKPCVSYGSPGPVMWVLETPIDVYQFGIGEVLSTG